MKIASGRIIIVAWLFHSVFCCQSSAESPEQAILLESVARSLRKLPHEGAREAAMAYRRLFAETCDSKLRSLSLINNHSIALQARWEMQRVGSARLRKPPQASGDLAAFVQSITNARVPPYWESLCAISLQEQSVSCESTTHSSYSGSRSSAVDEDASNKSAIATLIDVRPNLRDTPIGMKSRAGSSLELSDTTVVIGKNGQFVRIDRTLFDEARDMPLSPTVCTTLLQADKAFLALHHEVATGFSLWRVDPQSESVLWQADVWALYPCFSPSQTGPQLHQVFLSTGDNCIVVFGVDTGCYVEAFDLESGENLFRSATNYWGY